MKKPNIKVLSTILIVSVTLYIGLVILSKTYASYESSGTINLNSAPAMYIFNEDTMNFYIDLDKIVPSEDAYIYPFTISNFNASRRSDVDIEYTISLTTTTNLPLTYELYLNQQPLSAGATDIVSSREYRTDIDGAWYNVITIDDVYTFNYNSNMTNTYYLVVYFPINYASTLGYDNMTDNIEITINSKQKLSD